MFISRAGPVIFGEKKVPTHKDGNRCWCSQGKRWVKYGNWKLKYFEFSSNKQRFFYTLDTSNIVALAALNS